MNNIEILLNNENKSVKIFANTIVNLRYSQGFYSRLCASIDEMDDESLENLIETLKQQNFNNSVDVVLWLEC